jgi:shikimate kinase
MVEIYERRQWEGSKNLFLIGPGAAGKSTVGACLAPYFGRRMLDLDDEFRSRNGNIDDFIRGEGYQSYKLANSALAEELVRTADTALIMATSSGFLTQDNPPAALDANRRLLAASYSICLLPSRSLEQTVATIVARQLRRPFARVRAREEEMIRQRFPVYAELGDLAVFSEASSNDVAQCIADCLLRGDTRIASPQAR